MLLAAPEARAGTYVWQTTDADGNVTQSPTFSGGTFTCSFLSQPYGRRGNPPTSYGNDDHDGGQANCSGTITTIYTWQPAAGQTAATDPPPADVVVQETCYVDVNGSNGSSVPVTGICDTGLGVTAPLVNSNDISNARCNATRYKIMTGGQTVTLTCSPQAQCSGIYATTDVSYSPVIFPVTVDLNGALADSSHQLNILVGQQCEGIMNAGPVTLSNFQWTVPGVTFDHFYISSDQSQGYPVFIDPSVWTTENPFWHWSSSGNYAVSVTAQASINGQSIGQVTAQKSITVVTPPQVVASTPGASSFEISNGVVTAIQAGASGASGMQIDATVTTPNPFAQIDQSSGSYYYVQLIRELRDVNSGGFVIPFMTNGFVLDNQDPYNGSQSAYSPDTVKLIPFEFSDSPDQSIQYANGVNIADEFKAYIMYLPPSNGFDEQPVPIHLTQWDWTADAAMNNGTWAPDPPGSCTVVSDSASTEFPTWSASFTDKTGNSGQRIISKLSLYPFDEINFDQPVNLGSVKKSR